MTPPEPAKEMVEDLRREVEANKNILPQLNSVQKQYWKCLLEDEQRKLDNRLANLEQPDREAVEYVLQHYQCLVVMAINKVLDPPFVDQ